MAPGNKWFPGLFVLGPNDSQELLSQNRMAPGNRWLLGIFVLGPNDSQELLSQNRMAPGKIDGSWESLSWDQMIPRNYCPRTEWLPGIDGSRESLSWDQMIPRNYCPRTKWLPAISSLIQGFGINGYLSDSQEVFPGKPYLIDINLPR